MAVAARTQRASRRRSSSSRSSYCNLYRDSFPAQSHPRTHHVFATCDAGSFGVTGKHLADVEWIVGRQPRIGRMEMESDVRHFIEQADPAARRESGRVAPQVRAHARVLE